ncbi:MAG: LPXTG cell wall anchor domain-containing protein, partial [Acutalibacteraceae bacterium]|nr:LPXTG cell wall anchor domain-containing protein [Acutalibacteraceae bacterium]
TTPSTSPAPTSSPDATTTPAPTASPDATTTPAPTGTPGATATPAPTAEPETGTGPKTGDSTNAAPWAMLLLTAGAALTGTVLYSRKRKQNG